MTREEAIDIFAGYPIWDHYRKRRQRLADFINFMVYHKPPFSLRVERSEGMKLSAELERCDGFADDETERPQ
jgi:hypothetical protein